MKKDNLKIKRTYIHWWPKLKLLWRLNDLFGSKISYLLSALLLSASSVFTLLLVLLVRLLVRLLLSYASYSSAIAWISSSNVLSLLNLIIVRRRNMNLVLLLVEGTSLTNRFYKSENFSRCMLHSHNSVSKEFFNLIVLTSVRIF